MAQDITVTLTTEQVQQGLTYARKIKPDATNAELVAELTDAAYWGPGIREVIASWEMAATREHENENRQASQAAFLEDFPAKPDPDTDPPEPAAAKRTRKKKD